MTKKKKQGEEPNLAYLPFFYKDWMSSPSVKDMNHHEQHCYLYLLMYCFQDDGFPDDLHRMALMCEVRDQDMRQWWKGIKYRFYWDKEMAIWRNEKMDAAKKMAIEAHNKASGKNKPEISTVPEVPKFPVPPFPKTPEQKGSRTVSDEKQKPGRQIADEKLGDSKPEADEDQADSKDTVSPLKSQEASHNKTKGIKESEIRKDSESPESPSGNCSESQILEVSDSQGAVKQFLLSEEIPILQKVVVDPEWVLEDWKSILNDIKQHMGYRYSKNITLAISSYMALDRYWHFKYIFACHYIYENQEALLAGKTWLGLDKLFADEGKCLNELAVKRVSEDLYFAAPWYVNKNASKDLGLILWNGPEPSKAFAPTWSDPGWLIHKRYLSSEDKDFLWNEDTYQPYINDLAMQDVDDAKWMRIYGPENASAPCA